MSHAEVTVPMLLCPTCELHSESLDLPKSREKAKKLSRFNLEQYTDSPALTDDEEDPHQE